MKFSVNAAFLPVGEIVPIARAADRLGFHALGIPDHVVDLETIETPYPYTDDGSRRWSRDAEWPDPWVLFGALATVTERLHFFTSVYVPALRSPFQVAKSVSTAAALSGGRVALGVGIGWCREEYDLLEADFRTRGKRTDEGLALMKALWQPGTVEFAGEHYTAPRLTMEPTPPAPIPVYVGGMSDVAMRRAARHDGWIADMHSTDEAIGLAQRMAAVRAEAGVTGEFEVILALLDAWLPEHFARAFEGGVTQAMTMPWVAHHGFEATLEQKLDAMERFAADVIRPLSAG